MSFQSLVLGFEPTTSSHNYYTRAQSNKDIFAYNYCTLVFKHSDWLLQNFK